MHIPHGLIVYTTRLGTRPQSSIVPTGRVLISANHKKCSAHKHSKSAKVFCRQPLTEENARKYHRNQYTQLVNRHNNGCRSVFQRSVIAQPRKSGCNAGEDKKHIAFCGYSLCTSAPRCKNHNPRHNKDNYGAYCRTKI